MLQFRGTLRGAFVEASDGLEKKSREKVFSSMYGFYLLFMGFLCKFYVCMGVRQSY